MGQEHPVIAAVRQALEKNRAEREFLESSLRSALQFYAGEASQNGPAPVVPASRVERPTSAAQPAFSFAARNHLFVARPDGPSATMLALIRERPGLKITELLDEGERRVHTDAVDKRRNLAQTIRDLRKRKKIERREDGGHYALGA